MNLSLKIFRILTSFIFIYAGIKHILIPAGILRRISKSSVFDMLPYPKMFMAMILLSGVIMVVGAMMLLTGYQYRIAAIGLLLVLIPITLTVQLENLKDLGPFFKNIAIMGSLFFIFKFKPDEIKTPVYSIADRSA